MLENTNLSLNIFDPLIQNVVNVSEIGINRIVIAEGDEDWGAAEQSAYERLTDDRTNFVSGEELLDWIERLESGEDV
jgi:hypothetical protein